MNGVKQFINAITSRKFLLAAGTTAVFIANEQYDQALMTVVAYLGVNVADAKLNTPKT